MVTSLGQEQTYYANKKAGVAGVQELRNGQRFTGEGGVTSNAQGSGKRLPSKAEKRS
jgi:hypothetical protein